HSILGSSLFTLPLLLHLLGLLIFVFGLPWVVVNGTLRDDAWLIPGASALLQASAIVWMAMRFRAAPSDIPRGRYLFLFVLQNLGLWPSVVLLFVILAR
ncbi:MAG: hypothetical protein KAI47_25470, partial [Deltaproteobacteria bacterium]|nr:hypothetical protein [Deltaproteobacteria bacterium]